MLLTQEYTNVKGSLPIITAIFSKSIQNEMTETSERVSLQAYLIYKQNEPEYPLHWAAALADERNSCQISVGWLRSHVSHKHHFVLGTRAYARPRCSLYQPCKFFYHVNTGTRDHNKTIWQRCQFCQPYWHNSLKVHANEQTLRDCQIKPTSSRSNYVSQTYMYK